MSWGLTPRYVSTRAEAGCRTCRCPGHRCLQRVRSLLLAPRLAVGSAPMCCFSVPWDPVASLLLRLFNAAQGCVFACLSLLLFSKTTPGKRAALPQEHLEKPGAFGPSGSHRAPQFHLLVSCSSLGCVLLLQGAHLAPGFVSPLAHTYRHFNPCTAPE